MTGNKISVVIICKDAAGTIEKTIDSAFKVSDDVVVIDSGSTDGTIEIIDKTAAKLEQVKWNGYGDAKNAGNSIATHDWILSLDADEWIDEDLVESIKHVQLANENYLFTMYRLNYLGKKPIHYGEWRHDIVLRLFNKRNASWDISPVHEELLIKKPGQKVQLNGLLHHYTSPHIDIYKLKLRKYAELNAEKYYQKGKRAYWYKLYLSPLINFIQNYILKGGFLDGKEGWQIALAHAGYTYEKYRLLKERVNS